MCLYKWEVALTLQSGLVELSKVTLPMKLGHSSD